jgi:hypothetical protein
VTSSSSEHFISADAVVWAEFDSALALLSENVSWPKASEGGRAVGKEEIRSYWTRQWKEFVLTWNHLR